MRGTMRREAGREVGTMSWRSGYLGVAGAALLLVWGCRGAAEDVADLAAGEGLDSRDAAGDSPAHESESGPALVEQEQVPSQGYLARQAEYPPERDVSQEEPRVAVFICH